MVQLMTLAVLGAAMADVGGEQQWTVEIEMTRSSTELDIDSFKQDGVEQAAAGEWYSRANSFAVVGTYKPMELLSVSLRLGTADAPMIYEDNTGVTETRVFPSAFLWGLDAGSGGGMGSGDAFWDAGMKIRHIVGDYEGANDDYSLDDFRFGLYGNVGMDWVGCSAYCGLRLNWITAVYERKRAGPQPDQKYDLSQAAPFGLVVGFREKAERLSYSFELGFLDSLTASVGAGISF